MVWQRGLRLGALALGGILVTSCATTGVGVGIGTGAGPVRVGMGARTDTSDVLLSSTLAGAAIGSVAGPIGFGVGALIGAIYGVNERGRQERLVKVQMESQKEIDKDLLKQIEEQKKTQLQLTQALEVQLAQSETGLIVIKDHRTEELKEERVSPEPSAPPNETGLMVLKDHLAKEPKSGVSQEETKRKELETLIQKELERQEELLAKAGETGLPPPPGSPVLPLFQQGSGAPKPAASSGESVVEKEGFQWFYEESRLVRKERDLNGDGRPDLILFYDQAGKLLRQEEDTNLDGVIDAWTVFEDEQPVREEADTDSDGRIDFWASYEEKGELSRTESDTDKDGQRDLVSSYDQGTLVEEKRYEGRGEKLLAVTFYEKGRPVRKEEATKGGTFDRITYFDKEGRVVKEARDPLDRGRPSLFAYYDPVSKALLREEEDLDGDGEIEMVSYYEGGKLRKRELYKLDETPPLLHDEGSLREVERP